MAFITSKKVGHRMYLQVVENYRQDGKHRQRLLRHIGPYATLEHALADWQQSWAHGISLSDRQWTTQCHEQMGAELRHFLAEHNIAVDEAEVKRLLDMSEGQRWWENLRRTSVS